MRDLCNKTNPNYQNFDLPQLIILINYSVAIYLLPDGNLGLGRGLTGRTGLIGLTGLTGLMGLIGLTGLMGRPVKRENIIEIRSGCVSKWFSEGVSWQVSAWVRECVSARVREWVCEQERERVSESSS